MFLIVAAIPLRANATASDLRRLAKGSRDAGQARRLLALATIYDGGSRRQAARLGGVTPRIIRDRAVRINAEGPAGLANREAPGKAPLLGPGQRAALARAVEAGPKPCLDGVVRWRLVDLAAWLHEEFGISASRQTLGRELRAMGFRKLSARPQAYRQDPEAMQAFKKSFPAVVEEIRAQVGRPIEVWFQGEPDQRTVRGAVFPANARIGRKNRITRPLSAMRASPAGQRMGPARDPTPCGARPAHDVGLPLWCHLSETRCRRGFRNALRGHAGHAGAPRRDQRRDRARRPRHPRSRSGWLAHVEQTRGPGQQHSRAAAAPLAGADPACRRLKTIACRPTGREHLAVHARQPDLEPHLHLPRRHSGPLPRGLERTHRPASAHHVHRSSPMGTWDPIDERWYHGRGRTDGPIRVFPIRRHR